MIHQTFATILVHIFFQISNQNLIFSMINVLKSVQISAKEVIVLKFSSSGRGAFPGWIEIITSKPETRMKIQISTQIIA
jgi:hypothetical protein